MPDVRYGPYQDSVDVEIDVSAVGPALESKTDAIMEALTAKMGSVSLALQSAIVQKLSGELLQRRTGQLSNSIRTIPTTVGSDSITGGVLGGGGVAPYARALEDGSVAHVIEAKSAKALAFEVSATSNFAPYGGLFAKNGGSLMVIVKKVNHPGTKAYAFMKGTLDENRQNIIGEFQDSVKEGAGL
jgi:hypothetical protein